MPISRKRFKEKFSALSSEQKTKVAESFRRKRERTQDVGGFATPSSKATSVSEPQKSPIQNNMDRFIKERQDLGANINPATGEIINPTERDIQEFNKRFTTTYPDQSGSNYMFGDAATERGMGYIEKRDKDIAASLSGKYTSPEEVKKAVYETIRPGVKGGQGITTPDIQRTIDRITGQVQYADPQQGDVGQTGVVDTTGEQAVQAPIGGETVPGGAEQPPDTGMGAPDSTAGLDKFDIKKIQLAQQMEGDIASEMNRLESRLTEGKLDLEMFKDQAVNYDEVNADFEKFREVAGKQVADTGSLDIKSLARELRRDPQKVQDFVRGDFGKQVQFKADVEEGIKKPFQRQLDKLKTDYERQKDDIQRNRSRIAYDFNNKLVRAQEQQRIQNDNARIFSALTGVTFSTRGMEGLNNVFKQTNRMVGDIGNQEFRTLSDIDRTSNRLMEDFSKNDDLIRENMQNQINVSKQNFLTKMSALQDRYGEFSEESLSRIEGIKKQFEKDLDQINDQAIDAADRSFDRFVKTQALLDRQNQLEIQSEDRFLERLGDGIKGMNIEQIAGLAEQGRISPDTAYALTNRLSTDTISGLNDLYKGMNIGSAKAEEISQLVATGMSPNEIAQNILQSADVKPMIDRLTAEKKEPTTEGQIVKIGDQAYNIITDMEGNVVSQQVIGGEAEVGATPTGGGQVILQEQPVSTGIPNVYGGEVKLAPTVNNMIQGAQQALQSQGIELKIADSFVPSDVKQRAYEKRIAEGKKGPPQAGTRSFHVKGQAIDLSQTGADNMNRPEVFEALRSAGLQQHPEERRHWSYGEFGAPSKEQVTPTGGTKGEFDKSLLPLIQKFNAGEFNTTDLKLLEGMGVSETELAQQAQNYKESFNTAGARKDQEMIDLAEGLKTMKGKFGAALRADGIPLTQSASFASTLNQLKNNLTLDALASAKEKGVTFGALSEGEIKTVADSASRLSASLPREDFNRELDKIVSTLNKGRERETEQQQQTQQQATTGGQTTSLLDSLRQQRQQQASPVQQAQAIQTLGGGMQSAIERMRALRQQ